MVPAFMRAVTVALDPIIGVGGFLKPGDHVDVVATFEVNDGTVTKTVLQNVELLATGSEVTAEEINPKTGRMTGSKAQPNATLAVLPTDAEKLILAESKGKLRLTLRRPDDVSFTRMKGVTGRDVIGVVPPDAPEKPVDNLLQATLAGSVGQPVAVQQPTAPAPAAPAKAGSKPAAGKRIQIIRGAEVEETVVPE
jgi:pilus assembly protein CpaB